MNNPAKLIILISGRGSNMQSIIRAIQAQQLHAEICAVISNRPDAAGLQTATEAGIPTILIDHTQFVTRERFDEQLAEVISSFNPDYVILAGFMRILSAQFVSYFKDKLINIHPSLLPKYKGLNTHHRALAAGDTEHGASVHFVTAELDGGPVILQVKVPVFADDTEETLAARVLEQEHKLYPDAIRLLIEKSTQV